MNVLLINPFNRLLKGKYTFFHVDSLSLPVLASLTPEDFNVRILDEEIEEITFEEEADLVGISLMTHQAPRAYEISEKFRKRGIKTILGGIHVSALPDEALNHADSICVGEAEHLWKGILDDLKKGQLKKIYKAVSYHNLKSLPFPRLDLLKRECIFIPIYSSRGCPFRCEFCSVSRFFGSRYRRRPVEEVMEEIRFRKIERMEFTGWSNEPQLVLFWIDDNICGNKAYAYSLFRNLANFKIKWIAQATLNVAKDVNLLELMRKAGCFGLGIGIESLSQGNLNFVKKDFLKVSNFSESIRKIRDSGIQPLLYFIFGFENDDESVFENTLEFLAKNYFPMAIFNILTPLPGTEIYKRMEKENRIFEKDWSKYTGEYVVSKPKLLTPEKLQEGYEFINREYRKFKKDYELREGWFMEVLR